MADTTEFFNVIKNSNIQINCRANIKTAGEQQLVDAVINAVRKTDTHISRIRFDRNPKSWGSTSTRYVKQTYYSLENIYELYVNLAKVTNRAGFTDQSVFPTIMSAVLEECNKAKSQKFINKINKKYSLT